MFLTVPLRAWADGIYTYTQDDGTVVYTNVKPKNAKAKKLAGTFHRAPQAMDAPAPNASTVGQSFDEHIEAASKRYRIPAALVRAVMHAESNFDPNAVSPKGASGLMQLMPKTAEEMYVRDIFEPKQNIDGATRYLRVLANLFDGDMVKMVAAYNAGPEAVKKYNGEVPPYAETQAYVRKVVMLYFKYKARAEVAQNERR